MQILAFAGVYAIIGRLGLGIAPVQQFATLVWAGSGIALSVLLRAGFHLWPGVALGAFLVNVSHGASVPVALGIAVGNTLEPVLAAYLILRVAGKDWSLETVRGVLAFALLGALASTTVSASVGVASLFMAGLVPRPDVLDTWRVWWLGDVAGDLVVAPVLLAWSAPGAKSLDARRRAEAAALGAVLICATLLVFFHPPVAAPTGFLQACILIPLLTWTSVRFGVRGATAAIFLVSVIAVAGTASGHGPFAQDSLSGSLLHQQAFMAIVAVAVLVVGAVTAERVAALEALGESEELLRLYVEHSPAAVAMFDGEMRYLVASRRFLSDYKLSLEDIIGRSHYEVFPEVPERWKQIHRRCLSGAIETCDEEPFPRADGTVDWVRWEIHPWHATAGEIGGIILFSELITDRKRSLEALRESEERFRLLVQGVKDCAIYMLSPDGMVTSWSAAAEQMFGYREEEIVGQHREVLFTNEQRVAGRPHQDLDDALAIGSFEQEGWRVRKDGSRLWANVLITALREDGSSLRGFAIVTRDFTERNGAENALRESEARLRASEAALRDADCQKNRFLAMLSHELRNPLAPIRNSLYILECKGPGDEQAHRAQSVIRRQIGQMTRLIDELLDMTRIVHGKLKLQRERVALLELTQRTVEDHRAVFADSEIMLEVLPAEAEVWVNGDRVRLAQTIGNLLQNAVKFTPRGGKVTVSVESDSAQPQAILTVRDTGGGIEREMLPRLFRPFSQADTTLDRSQGGLGLGLALVKEVVEMHDGMVSAASDGPGKGAAFTIRLPLDLTALREGPAQCSGGADGPPRRVLVIDDNEDAADTLREVLTFDEHVVEVAYDGRTGIEKARAFHPDVVLCDIGLPEMNGYEVARMMRADPDLGHVGLVAVSGYAQPEDVAMAKEAGFDAHLAKPPSIETLERALAKVRNAR